MEKKTIGLSELNQMIRENLDNYYRNRDAGSFFTIDSLLSLCRKHNLTVTDVPALIEMQNVIVMG